MGKKRRKQSWSRAIRKDDTKERRQEATRINREVMEKARIRGRLLSK